MLTAATPVAGLPEPGRIDGKTATGPAPHPGGARPGLREFYRGLRARGKPGKIALVAVMRKLAMQLNAIAGRATPWAPKPAPAG